MQTFLDKNMIQSLLKSMSDYQQLRKALVNIVGTDDVEQLTAMLKHETRGPFVYAIATLLKIRS
jgi:ABC-type arginine transport system permease subunit